MASTVYGIISYQKPVEVSSIEALQKADTRTHTDRLLLSHPTPTIFMGLNLRFLTPESRFEATQYPQFPHLHITFVGRLLDTSTLRQKLAISEKSCPDSALILYAYEKWGTDCVKNVMGEYLFTLYDTKRHLFFTANSPFSVYSLIYHKTSEGIHYASLFPTLKASLSKNPEYNLGKMADYLTLSHSQKEATFYKDIYQLPQGYTLSIQDKKCQVVRFWSMHSLKLSRIRYAKKTDYAEHLSTLLHEILKDYLRSDFAVGSHISGGLDSSSIAAICAKLLAPENKRLQGFGSIPGAAVIQPNRKNWVSDDSFRMQALADQYPNIDLHLIPQYPINLSLKNAGRYYHHHLDKLPRNPSNIGWVFDIQNEAEKYGVRSMLIGGNGNATFSWAGSPDPYSYTGLKRSIRKHVINPIRQFLSKNEPWAKHSLIRHDAIQQFRIPKTTALSQPIKNHFEFIQTFQEGVMNDALGIFHHIQAHSGVYLSDPTTDLRLIQFLLSIPDSVYQEGGTKRWLIREALKEDLPPCIRDNTTRGDQNSLWLEDLTESLPFFNEIFSETQTHDVLNQLIDLSEFKSILFDLNALTEKEILETPAKDLMAKYQVKFLRALMLVVWLNADEKEKGSGLA